MAARRPGRRAARARCRLRAPRTQALCAEAEQLEYALLRHRRRGVPGYALGPEPQGSAGSRRFASRQPAWMVQRHFGSCPAASWSWWTTTPLRSHARNSPRAPLALFAKRQRVSALAAAGSFHTKRSRPACGISWRRTSRFPSTPGSATTSRAPRGLMRRRPSGRRRNTCPTSRRSGPRHQPELRQAIDTLARPPLERLRSLRAVPYNARVNTSTVDETVRAARELIRRGRLQEASELSVRLRQLSPVSPRAWSRARSRRRAPISRRPSRSFRRRSRARRARRRCCSSARRF